VGPVDRAKSNAIGWIGSNATEHFELRVQRNLIYRCECRLALFETHAATGSRSRRHTIETVICHHGLAMYHQDAEGSFYG
jgi:hypothetical protein